MDEIAWAPTTEEPTMAGPAVGETLYLTSKRTMPVRVVHTEGTHVWFVPLHTDVKHTHQGNLYDSEGNRKYMV